MTFCVVPCGSAQNARSSLSFGQSAPSIAVKIGSGYGTNCGNTSAIGLPARRSAVSNAMSTRGWRIKSRNSSAPV
jgi:hypothetical protein